LPLLERVRVEVYLPDPSQLEYENLLLSLEEEFTYAFGGCTTVRGLQGSYLSKVGKRIPSVKRAAIEVLSEEDVMISIEQVYHAV
jgi:hypothetical protein